MVWVVMSGGCCACGEGGGMLEVTLAQGVCVVECVGMWVSCLKYMQVGESVCGLVAVVAGVCVPCVCCCGGCAGGPVCCPACPRCGELGGRAGGGVQPRGCVTGV